MDTESIIRELDQLIQLDIDAAHAYQQALERIDIVGVAETIEGFRQDHERHIASLSQVVARLGGQPTEQSRDVEGYLNEGFTALRSSTGTEGALKAMSSNETLTNESYERALSLGLPADIEAIVRGNREDERRHLEYLERALEDEVWNTTATHQQPHS